MNEPRYTVEELRAKLDDFFSARADTSLESFLDYLSSLHEQEEQPVDRESEQTRQTGTPPKIEPLDIDEKTIINFPNSSMKMMSEKIEELVSAVNQLASKKEN